MHRKQEQLGLDMLVHGEFERTDMVEHFGQLLSGFAFTEIRLGAELRLALREAAGALRRRLAPRADDCRSGRRYAQSLTKLPVKGMLTGPVTILAVVVRAR